MSFRTRLTIFFTLIVVVPMLALAALLIQVTGEARSGKSDARLGKGLETARAIYGDALRRGRSAAREVSGDPRVIRALGDEPQMAADAAERALARSGALAVVLSDASGAVLAEAGSDRPIASGRVRIRAGGAEIGSVVAAGTDAPAYVREVLRLTNLQAALVNGDELLASTPEVAAVPPRSGSIEIEGEEMRTASLSLSDSSGSVRLTLAGPLDSASVTSNRTIIIAALALFFALASGFAIVLVRSLQGQIATMLDAARRIGGGDFDIEVPAEGRDEMAGLAEEFNKMSGRLSRQMGELRHERERVTDSIRRLGDAFGSGLDRGATLQVLAEAAHDACGADGAIVRLNGTAELFSAGGAAANGAALHEVTARFGGQDGDPGGEISVTRQAREFTEAERGILEYLAGQAAIAVGRAEMHAEVARQAVTDELTGLANNRRFGETLERELERAERFGHPLGLVMIDLDDFKQVNDTHGHLQGDAVLRAVAEVLRSHSRAVDEPARYGGEELAIVLPETDLAGARLLAERIRTAVAEKEVRHVDGREPIHVTASFGVASYPAEAADRDGLIEAADGALYRAKRGGKNRVETAGPDSK